MRLLLVLVVAAIGGCIETVRLDGSWVAMISEYPLCDMRLTFYDNSYEYEYACQLEDGSYGAEVEYGIYKAVSTGYLTFYPTHATCDGVTTGGQEFLFKTGGNHLSVDNLFGDGETTEFVRKQALDRKKVLGCYTEDDGFQEAPLIGLSAYLTPN